MREDIDRAAEAAGIHRARRPAEAEPAATTTDVAGPPLANVVESPADATPPIIDAVELPTDTAGSFCVHRSRVQAIEAGDTVAHGGPADGGHAGDRNDDAVRVDAAPSTAVSVAAAAAAATAELAKGCMDGGAPPVGPAPTIGLAPPVAAAPLAAAAIAAGPPAGPAPPIGPALPPAIGAVPPIGPALPCGAAPQASAVTAWRFEAQLVHAPPPFGPAGGKGAGKSRMRVAIGVDDLPMRWCIDWEAAGVVEVPIDVGSHVTEPMGPSLLQNLSARVVTTIPGTSRRAGVVSEYAADETMPGAWSISGGQHSWQ